MQRYQVRRLSEDTADGNWQDAIPLADFSFPWETRPPPETLFRACWNGDAFRFRFDCVDDDIVLGSGGTIKERVLDSDRVELFIAPDLSLDPYYCFEIAPNGDVLAYRAAFYRRMDWQWSCPCLQVRAEISAGRYSVEASLPLQTLRDLQVLREPSREIIAGIYRAEFSRRPDGAIHQGWMPWIDPETQRPDFHVPASFGVFEFVEYS